MYKVKLRQLAISIVSVYRSELIFVLNSNNSVICLLYVNKYLLCSNSPVSISGQFSIRCILVQMFSVIDLHMYLFAEVVLNRSELVA